MKRLVLANDDRVHEEQWPDHAKRRRKGHLYAGRQRFRKVRVMVDAELLEAMPADAVPTDRQLVTELLQHQLVSLFRYADDGPPPGTKPGPYGAYDGWVVVESSRSGLGYSVVYSSEPGSATRAGTRGNALERAQFDGRTPVYTDMSWEDAGWRRRADALAALVAGQALGADLYVTDRPYLQVAGSRVARGLAICRPPEALAVLGLYFRAQGVFPIRRNYFLQRGTFYWVGTRELLPQAWRWLGACVQYSLKQKDDGLMLLGGSLLQRVDRALESRDQIHLALSQPQTYDTREAALSTLDVVLVLLMAAIDVAARVAHRVLQLPVDEEYKAGWQKQSTWLKHVRHVAPALAAVVDPSSRGEAALTIVRLLRNSVHGSALQGIRHRNGERELESLVALPADTEAVRLRMVAFGGLKRWGVRLVDGNQLHLDPGVLVDQLITEVAWLLNQLMENTPVERLPNVALTRTDCQPPAGAESRDFEWAPWIRRTIRAQIGL